MPAQPLPPFRCQLLKSPESCWGPKESQLCTMDSEPLCLGDLEWHFFPCLLSSQTVLGTYISCCSGTSPSRWSTSPCLHICTNWASVRPMTKWCLSIGLLHLAVLLAAWLLWQSAPVMVRQFSTLWYCTRDYKRLNRIIYYIYIILIFVHAKLLYVFCLCELLLKWDVFSWCL